MSNSWFKREGLNQFGSSVFTQAVWLEVGLESAPAARVGAQRFIGGSDGAAQSTVLLDVVGLGPQGRLDLGRAERRWTALAMVGMHTGTRQPAPYRGLVQVLAPDAFEGVIDRRARVDKA